VSGRIGQARIGAAQITIFEAGHHVVADEKIESDDRLIDKDQPRRIDQLRIVVRHPVETEGGNKMRGMGRNIY